MILAAYVEILNWILHIGQLLQSMFGIFYGVFLNPLYLLWCISQIFIMK